MMEEKDYKKWDIRIKLATVLVAFFVLLFSLFQYKEIKEKEFKISHWNSQVKICQTGSQLATQAAIEISRSKVLEKTTIDKLYSLSFGEGRLFLESAPLETIQLIMQRGSTCTLEKNCEYHFFNVNALNFSKQCETMISNSWNRPLSTISD